MNNQVSVPYLSGQALQSPAAEPAGDLDDVSVPYLSGQALQSHGDNTRHIILRFQSPICRGRRCNSTEGN